MSYLFFCVECCQVSGVGYDLDGEITTEETYLNQGHLVERVVVVDHLNHPGIRKIVEVRIFNNYSPKAR